MGTGESKGSNMLAQNMHVRQTSTVEICEQHLSEAVRVIRLSDTVKVRARLLLHHNQEAAIALERWRIWFFSRRELSLTALIGFHTLWSCGSNRSCTPIIHVRAEAHCRYFRQFLLAGRAAKKPGLHLANSGWWCLSNPHQRVLQRVATDWATEHALVAHTPLVVE